MSNEKNYHSPLFGITAFLEDLEVVSSGFVFQNQFKSVKFQSPVDRFSRRVGSQKLLKSFLVRKSFVLDPPTFSDGETNVYDFISMQNLLDVPQKSGHFMNAMASEKFKDYCWPVLTSRRVIEVFRSDNDDRKDPKEDVPFGEQYSDLAISQMQWQNGFSAIIPRIQYPGGPSHLVNTLFDSSFFVHCPNNQLMRLSYSRHLEGVLDSICQMVTRLYRF
jgi:hypothetical protein